MEFNMYKRFSCISLFVLFTLVIGAQAASSPDASSVFGHFVTVAGDRLMDGDKPLRFISCNIPNLHCIEDYMAFEETNPWRMPDAFEIRDALESIKAMGGSVTRMYTITVRRKDDSADIPRYVLGPGQFNEEAFRALDQVLASANKVGVRIIIPFVDNWSWMGGRAEYAGFRNKKSDEFWTDPQIKEDFKKTIAYIINRKNTITGTIYRDDKAVLAWETGNELASPNDWVLEMGGYIKSLDRNHLLLDGYTGYGLRDESINNPYTDIITTHHYERDPLDMLKIIRASAEKAKGKKPYLIGEFGFLGLTGVAAILQQVESSAGICGALIWSLRFHSRDGGFYWHSEPGAGGYFYKAYHWPGFATGENYAEKDVMQLLCERGYKIKGEQAPTLAVPKPPQLLACDDPARLTWQGAVGAFGYDVERSASKNGPWKRIAYNVSDTETAHRPLYNDDDVALGATCYYRVRSRNGAGISEPSNIIGPITVQHKTLVDECWNFAIAFSRNGDLSMQTDNSRAFKEDAHRLAAKPGAQLVYYTPGAVQSVKLYVFAKTMQDNIKVSVSTNGTDYAPLPIDAKSFYSGPADYDYWRPILYKSDAVPADAHFIKIAFLQESQLGRAELMYGK
jgi:mannan endo-1,4-beta-mannosidase